MKRLLALVLVTLMVVPFAVFASAAAAPAEPTLTATTKLYMAYDYDETKTAIPNGSPAKIDNDGKTPATALTANAGKGNIWGNGEGVDPKDGAVYKALKEGGTIVAVGKVTCGANGIIPATTSPILFTAKDGTTDYTSRKPDGSINFMSETGGNAGQYGMFLMDTAKTITFQGDVIFDNIVILSRLGAGTDKHSGTIVVDSTGKLVIKDTVQFAKMMGDECAYLEVKEGGYAYLHAVGFQGYTGKGTIVLDKALVSSGKVTKATFEGFEGKIIAQDGTDPFAAPDPGPIPTGDMTWVVAAVASIAVMGTAVVVSKKRA